MDKDFSKSLMKLILAQGIWNDSTNIEYSAGMKDMIESMAQAQASLIVSFLKTTGKCVPDEISAGCKASYETTFKIAMKMWQAVKDEAD
jgi:hypothetical protein